MSFVDINGAHIYYEIFGDEQPNRLPIVLIHSAPRTGRSDWHLVAPLLGREYRVIVPDCRGHGQSTNPSHTYSFRQMAADTAGLVRALGYERVHVVGHSNGGNVALVTLLEYPEVVQTAVLQAANAYVSPDLIEKEPSIFDPDRVARENPAWMREMIQLHGPVHGPDYWRDLLRLTVQEIITEPNYTPADLAQVKRPTLVVQGESDRVNAPARHAQFIAGHIPAAELWIPSGIGHNVHEEVLVEWIERILGFLRRRGDDANDALYRLRQARFSDERETIFDVRAVPSPEKPKDGDEAGVVISGRVLTADQEQAILDTFPPRAVTNQVRVLLSESTPWALVNRNLTDLRRQPSSFSELLSQVLLGEAVRLLEEDGEWILVRVEQDGYLGWIRSSALHRCSHSEVESYRASCNTIVMAELATAYLSPSISEQDSVDEEKGEGYAGKLPFGINLPVVDGRNGLSAVRLPDDRVWWVAESDLLPLAERPCLDSAGITNALALIERFIGVPYLWGGRTPFGFDCSGLAQTFLGVLGLRVPRDADQQFKAGIPVEGVPQPGDLLYFGEESELSRRPITHAGISLGGDEMIHANGAAGGVSLNNLNPARPGYRAWLRENLAGVRRFA